MEDHLQLTLPTKVKSRYIMGLCMKSETRKLLSNPVGELTLIVPKRKTALSVADSKG